MRRESHPGKELNLMSIHQGCGVVSIQFFGCQRNTEQSKSSETLPSNDLIEVIECDIHAGSGGSYEAYARRHSLFSGRSSIEPGVGGRIGFVLGRTASLGAGASRICNERR